MSNLLHFLTELALEPQKQEAFIKFPEVVMDAAGLSKAYKTALKSGDKTQIYAPFTGEYPQISYWTSEPNPDPLPDPDPIPPPPPPAPKDLENYG
ncbi:MAG: hypothetical protein F6K31_23235 [Symploca sp. SIO2G7]|nr:hypothetical protein [Symploca sp. SIO2G7]